MSDTTPAAYMVTYEMRLQSKKWSPWIDLFLAGNIGDIDKLMAAPSVYRRVKKVALFTLGAAKAVGLREAARYLYKRDFQCCGGDIAGVLVAADELSRLAAEAEGET